MLFARASAAAARNVTEVVNVVVVSLPSTCITYQSLANYDRTGCISDAGGE